MLALEFSSIRRSVAIRRTDGALFETSETGGRATNACALINQALQSSKTERGEIRVIVVGAGPGSYTGVRAAIAVAQGWQLARGVKIQSVSSMESIAKHAQRQNILGRLNVVVDAQRGEFYVTTYLVSKETIQEISALKIMTRIELESSGIRDEICLGPETHLIKYPSAEANLLLAQGREDYIHGSGLKPIYLREASFAKVSPTSIRS